MADQQRRMQRQTAMAFYEPTVFINAKLIVLTKGQMRGLRSWLLRLSKKGEANHGSSL